MSAELPDRTVIGSIWDVGPDDAVVTVRDRFSKPTRRPHVTPSREWWASRAFPREHDAEIARDRRLGILACIISAAAVIATIYALGKWCGSW